ncbi:MAG TPA: hypothetical protein VFP50_16065 [Anaeromyxobacteraceae bacterium]|nr:hypothetical protein [Anaeromyxobacteraceae bacterium]
MRRLLDASALLAVAALLASACTPRVVVPDAERERTRTLLDGQQRYTRVALSVHPLFGDGSKRLLLDGPPADADLLRGGNDELIAPPAAERILPPGTPVRVVEVEFPTPFVIARRVVMTPRYHPWAILKVAGDARPHVLVLSQTAATADEVVAEVDRDLTTDDPSPALRGLPAEQHDAVLRKELTEGMPLQAVEMAWGLPEKKRIDRPAATEEWSWPGGKRRAFFQDEKLVRWER